MKQIETKHLFPQLTKELLELLRSLNESDWLKPSPIEGRTVKDLVSHIIDGSLRKLSIQRDGFANKSNVPNIKAYNDLINYIQTLNNEWINVTRHLSSKILIDLLEYSENEFNTFIATLNPDDTAIFPVNWAGENISNNWFDIAREYTEVWHHQMQIRLALDKPLLLDPKFTEPLYDTFMRGLPFLYKDFAEYEAGYKINICITGTLNRWWTLEKQGDSWVLINGLFELINTSVELSDDIAWQIFTNTDREKEKYKSIIKIRGEEKIGLRLLEYVTVLS